MWRNTFGDTCFHVPESPGDADTDPGRREKTLESCEIAFGRRVFTCRRPSEAPRPPQEARGCPRRPPEGPRMPIHTCFHVPERHQDADSHVFLRVGEAQGGPRRPTHTCFYVFSLRVAEAPGGPRMPQDGPQIRVFTCFPWEWQSLRFHHTCFYVSAVVSASFGAVSRTCHFSRSGGLLARSYVKTRAASEQAETASV